MWRSVVETIEFFCNISTKLKPRASHPPGGDWNSHWRQRLSLRSVLVGRPKGRTEKALRERVITLCENKATRPQGILLQEYHNKVKRAMAWRGGSVVQSLSDQVLHQDLDMFASESCLLPAVVGQALVARKAASHVTERKWEDFFDTIMAFTPDGTTSDDFNPKLPLLSQLPRVMKFKLQTMQTAILTDVISPMLFEGSASLPALSTLVRAGTAAMERQDAMVMDKDSAVALHDWTLVMSGLQAVCTLPFDSSHEEAIRALIEKPAKPQPDHGPVQVCRTVLADATFYAARAQQYMDALPLMMEKETAWSEHLLLLGRLEGSEFSSHDVDWISALTTMHSDYSVVSQAVSADSLGSVGARLLALTCRFVPPLVEATKSVTELQDRINDIASLLQAASVAFPLEVAIPGWQLALHEIRQTHSAKATTNTFVNALQSIIGTEVGAPVHVDDLEVLHAAANRSAGLALDASSQKIANSALDRLARDVARAGFQGHSERTEHVAAEVLRCLPATSGWKAVWAWFKPVIGLASHSSFLVDDDDRAESVPAVRRLLAVVADEVKAMQGFDFQALGEGLEADVAESIRAIYSKYKGRDDQMKMKAVDASVETVSRTYENLLPLAYGSNDDTKAWSTGMKAKADFDAVLELANEKGLMSLDMGDLADRINKLQEALDGSKHAHDMAGKVVDQEFFEKAENLWIRAAVTQAERKIIDAGKIDDEDNRRSVIQAAVRQLRATKVSKILREKEVLPGPLYRWAFKMLTTR